MHVYMYSNNTGGWSEEGVILDIENTNSTTLTCVTTHLTSFAVLFQGAKKVSNNTTTVYLSAIQTILTNNTTSSNTSLTNSTTIQTRSQTSAHDEALSIVSYIGCGISIICLLATIIIILLFRFVVL